MPNYHAYDRSGVQKTDVGNVTFDNLTSDMAALRKLGDSLGIADAAVTSIGVSTNKRPILALKIGKNPANRILLVGCHHAREWISVEIPFLIGKYLIDNYKTALAAKTKKEKTINHLVDNAEIWIVPMLNPDGHLETLLPGRGMWRANTRMVDFPADVVLNRNIEKVPFSTGVYKTSTMNYDFKAYKMVDKAGPGTRVETETIYANIYEGVDLNRNYPVPSAPGPAFAAWGTETVNPTPDPKRPTGGYYELYPKSGPLKGAMVNYGWTMTTSRHPEPPDVFCGPSAGSEAEVQALAKLVGNGFKAIISYHNYSQQILYPDGAALHAGTQFLGKGMRDLFKDQSAKHAYVSGSGFYPTSGDTMEWAWRVHNVVNYTIELAPTDAEATANNWGFNRLPAARIGKVFKANLPVALCAINCAIAKFAPPAPVLGKSGKVVKVPPNCWEEFKGWVP